MWEQKLISRSILLATLCLAITSLATGAELVPVRELNSSYWQWSPAADHHRSVVIVSCNGGQGSGGYVHYQGISGVLTAAHVATGAKATVRFPDGTEKTGDVTQDKYGHDVAFVFVTHDVPAIVVAPSDPIPNERLEYHGYGGPEAELRHWYARHVETDDRFLNSDANVIFGDSGGPILDSKNHLVGIQSTGNAGGTAGPDQRFPVLQGAHSPATRHIRALLDRICVKFRDSQCFGDRCEPQPRFYYPPAQSQPQPQPPAEPSTPPAAIDYATFSEQLVQRLKGDAEFIAAVTGPRGPPGQDGRVGMDGQVPDFDGLLARYSELQQQVDQLQSHRADGCKCQQTPESIVNQVIAQLPKQPAYFEIVPRNRLK